jgi:hypothetical protein
MGRVEEEVHLLAADGRERRRKWVDPLDPKALAIMMH